MLSLASTDSQHLKVVLARRIPHHRSPSSDIIAPLWWWWHHLHSFPLALPFTRLRLRSYIFPSSNWIIHYILFNPFSNCSWTFCRQLYLSFVRCFNRFAVYYAFHLFTDLRLYTAVVMAASTAVRVCSACPTRLPSLSFDAHMVCHNCRGQVCDLNSFCDECRDWSDSFRNIYVSHMRSLETKRRYKQKKKASLASSPAPSEQSVIDTDSEINANFQ